MSSTNRLQTAAIPRVECFPWPPKWAPAEKVVYSLTDEIRKLLMSEWDPCGINDVAECADEYDNYIAGVKFLCLRKSISEIAEYLHFIETDYMGGLNNKSVEDLRPLAEKLFWLGANASGGCDV